MVTWRGGRIMSNSSLINIEDINRNLQESYIHYDPNRVDYTINNLELELLEQTGNNIWKDVFIATLSIGIPTLLNGFSLFSKLQEKSVLSIDIFFNWLIAGICIVLAVICFIVWQKTKKSFNELITQIKNKPKYRLPSTEQTI